MKIIVCFKLESDKINLLKLQGHIKKFSLVQFNIEVNFGQKRAKKGLNNSDIEEIFDLQIFSEVFIRNGYFKTFLY